MIPISDAGIWKKQFFLYRHSWFWIERTRDCRNVRFKGHSTICYIWTLHLIKNILFLLSPLPFPVRLILTRRIIYHGRKITIFVCTLNICKKNRNHFLSFSNVCCNNSRLPYLDIKASAPQAKAFCWFLVLSSREKISTLMNGHFCFIYVVVLNPSRIGILISITHISGNSPASNFSINTLPFSASIFTLYPNEIKIWMSDCRINWWSSAIAIEKSDSVIIAVWMGLQIEKNTGNNWHQLVLVFQFNLHSKGTICEALYRHSFQWKKSRAYYNLYVVVRLQTAIWIFFVALLLQRNHLPIWLLLYDSTWWAM